MEGDFEIIINAIKGDNMNLSDYGHLLYKTLSFLALLLKMFLFTMLEDKGIV